MQEEQFISDFEDLTGESASIESFTDQPQEPAREASPSKDFTELDLKVQIRPETLKKLKILAILSSYEVVEQLKRQLEEQVNHAFDSLITDEMMSQLKNSGMLAESYKTAAAQDGSDFTSHELSEDAAEEVESAEDLASKGRVPSFPGRVIQPEDSEAAALKPSTPRFANVDEDADAFLDTIFGGQGGGNDLDPPPIRTRPRSQLSEDALMAQAAGLYSSEARTSKATKAFNSTKPRVSVRGFDGDEDTRF
jgi:hypothetical protein